MNYDNYEPITASQCGESFLVALGGGGGGEDQQGEVGASEDGLTCSNILHEYPKLSSRPFGSDDKEGACLLPFGAAAYIKTEMSIWGDSEDSDLSSSHSRSRETMHGCRRPSDTLDFEESTRVGALVG